MMMAKDNMYCVAVDEHALVLLAVMLCKRRHHPVDLLSLPWQPKAPQELPECLDQQQVRELVEGDKLYQHSLLQLVSAS